MIRIRGMLPFVAVLLLIAPTEGPSSVLALDNADPGVPTRKLEQAEIIRNGFGFRSDRPYILDSFSDPVGFPDSEWGFH